MFDQAIGGSVIFCCLRKCGQIGKYYIFKVQYYMCILYKELLVCYIIRLSLLTMHEFVLYILPKIYSQKIYYVYCLCTDIDIICTVLYFITVVKTQYFSVFVDTIESITVHEHSQKGNAFVALFCNKF